jgi:hypothetical protein
MPLVGIIEEGEELLWDDALALSLKGMTEFPYPLLAAIRASNKDRYPISASKLGHCPRQSYYQATVDYYVVPGGQLAPMMGTWAHTLVEENTPPNTMAELELSWTTPEGVRVTGTADLVDVPNSTLSDWKTTRWMVPAKLPYGTHASQVNVYRWLLWKDKGIKVDRLQICYVDVSGPDKKKGTHNGYYAVDIDVWDDSVIDPYIRENALLLHQLIYEGNCTLPKRVGGDKKWMCRFCPPRIYEACYAE